MSRKTKALEFANEAYKINITGRHVLVTDPMKDYAVEKLSKIERFSHRIIDINVTMDIQKLEHRVSIVLKFDHIKIKSQAATNNMYASIDEAVDKLVRQLQRYKTKIQDHQARGVKVIDMNVNVLRPYAEDTVRDINEKIEEENERELIQKYTPHSIVSKETRPLKHLTYHEAVMKMELSNDAFLVFRSEEDNLKLKIMYRRNDGNFGVIEPEA